MDYRDTEVRLTENMKRILAPHVLCGYENKTAAEISLNYQDSFTSLLQGINSNDYFDNNLYGLKQNKNLL